MKHREPSEEILINLKGKIGIFLPMQPDKLQVEKDALNYVLELAKDQKDIQRDEITKIAKDLGKESVLATIILRFEAIRNKRVFYNEEEFQKVNKGLKYSDLDIKNCGLFDQENVNYCHFIVSSAYRATR